MSRLVSFSALALLATVLSTPVHAESMIASSLSDSISNSVGSISKSIKQSSNSSSKATPLAAGDYRIVDVALADDQPGQVRLHLQALADATEQGELYLTLPQTAFDKSQLAQGGVITAQTRSYGVEFAAATTREPFFLVVHDTWMRDLQTLPVTL